jgi:IS30 family transposase
MQIAIDIKMHVSSIYRELKRNSDERNSNYKADLASTKCKKRHNEKLKNQCFDNNIKLYVSDVIKDDLSPEQLVGKSLKDGVICVCHETIYKFVLADKKNGGDLYTHLISKGKIYRKRGALKDKRGQIVGRIGIENRPIAVSEKQRFGDLEIDLVIGKDHKRALLTYPSEQLHIV